MISTFMYTLQTFASSYTDLVPQPFCLVTEIQSISNSTDSLLVIAHSILDNIEEAWEYSSFT